VRPAGPRCRSPILPAGLSVLVHKRWYTEPLCIGRSRLVNVDAANENCTGLAQIARLGPTVCPKIPIKALKLAYNLGQPSKFFVTSWALCG
jgi:hypothetical protein